MALREQLKFPALTSRKQEYLQLPTHLHNFKDWSKIKVSHSCFLLSSLACKWPSSCWVYIWSSLCANIPLMSLFLMALVMNQYLSSFNTVTSLKAQSLNVATLWYTGARSSSCVLWREYNLTHSGLPPRNQCHGLNSKGEDNSFKLNEWQPRPAPALLYATV